MSLVVKTCTFARPTLSCSSLSLLNSETMCSNTARCDLESLTGDPLSDPDTCDFQLKKLINQTASELDSVGLGPSLLRALREHGNPGHDLAHSEEQAALPVDSEGVSHASYNTIVYEIAFNSSVPEPRLRLSSRSPSDVETHRSSTPTIQPIHHVDLFIPEQFLDRIRRALPRPSIMFQDEMRLPDNSMESYASALPWSHLSLTAVVQ
jgi:hypothetical protein